jgi:hypothetical protein
MKLQLSTEQAVDLLMEDDNAGWTHEGARALVLHLESEEEDDGQERDFNRVEIRCEWSEYPTLAAALEEYSECCDTLWELEERTTVLRFPSFGNVFEGVLIRAF